MSVQSAGRSAGGDTPRGAVAPADALLVPTNAVSAALSCTRADAVPTVRRPAGGDTSFVAVAPVGLFG